MLEKLIEKALMENEGRYRQLFSEQTVEKILKEKEEIVNLTLEDRDLLKNIIDSIEESIRIYLLIHVDENVSVNEEVVV